MEALAAALAAGPPATVDELSPPVGPTRRAPSRSGRSPSCRRRATPPTMSASSAASVCFCGDLVLGERLVDRPAGGRRRIAGRLHGLAARLAALDVDLLAPGHGPWITDPAGRARRVRRPPRGPRAAPAAPRSSRGERSRDGAAGRGLGRRPRAAAPGGRGRHAGAPREARRRGCAAGATSAPEVLAGDALEADPERRLALGAGALATLAATQPAARSGGALLRRPLPRTDGDARASRASRRRSRSRRDRWGAPHIRAGSIADALVRAGLLPWPGPALAARPLPALRRGRLAEIAGSGGPRARPLRPHARPAPGRARRGGRSRAATR